MKLELLILPLQCSKSSAERRARSFSDLVILDVMKFVVVSLIVLGCAWVLKSFLSGFKRRRAWSKLPRPKGVFLLGNLKEMVGFKNYQDTCKALQQSGGICGIRLATLRVGDCGAQHAAIQIPTCLHAL